MDGSGHHQKIEECHMCIYGDSIVKSPHSLEKGGGEWKLEYNGRGGLVQNTLYTCMKLSQ
jgi:hypothetical protein